MIDSEKIAVFTTAEKVDAIRSIVGVGAEFTLNPEKTNPLETTLANLIAGGAELAIIDEEHFYSRTDFIGGLKKFLDDPTINFEKLRIIVVCTGRHPGDPILEHLVSYLGLYDIVYDCDVMDIMFELENVINNPMRRIDVLELIKPLEEFVEKEGVVTEPQPSVQVRRRVDKETKKKVMNITIQIPLE